MKAKLQEILQHTWPALLAFEKDSINAGAMSRRRGPSGGDEKSRTEEPMGENQHRHRRVDFNHGRSPSWREDQCTEATHNTPSKSKRFSDQLSVGAAPSVCAEINTPRATT